MKKLLLALPVALLMAACSPPQAPSGKPVTPITPMPSSAPPTAPADAAEATDATDAAAGQAAVPAVASSADGAAVYAKACVTCHGTGLAGAPKLGDAADWGPRIAQGEALLLEHSIKGFTGKKGMMPPRGGFMNLSDEEMRAAVAYMVSQSGG